MKKESIGLAVCLMLLFGAYIAVQNYYLKKNQAEISQNSTTAQTTPYTLSNNDVKKESAPVSNPTTPSSTPTTASNAPLPLSVANPDDVKVTVPYAHFEFTPKGGCLGNNELSSEHMAYNNNTPVSVIANYNVCKAFGFKVGEQDLRTEAAGISKTPKGDVQIVQRTKDLEIIRTFHFSDERYTGSMEINVKNISSQKVQTNVDMEMGATSDDKHAGGMFSMTPPEYHGVALRLADETIKREYTPFEGSPDRKVLIDESRIIPTWMSVESLYWMNTLIPQFRTPLDFVVLRTGYNLMKNSTSEADQTVYEAWVKHPVTLEAGGQQSFSYKIYFGPKSENLLKQFEQDKLDETIDYGFFKIIARPLYYALNFIHGLVKNWGLAIIVLTIVINLVFMPLQIKGYASAQKMQIIQPKIKQLQEKFKEDKQTLHKETMALMAQHGVNPLSGCLPLLPQIPVFFGLNSALQHTFDLRQSPFFFWIHDLTLHDPYFVLPVIMAVLMLGYQRMMPVPSMDPNQAKMMKFLPLIFSLFMVAYPSGLALYVITNTVISMIRQTFLSSHFKKK